MNTISLLYRYISDIFPMVEGELDIWKQNANLCPDILKVQALSSIENKGFHAKGGCAFALYPKCRSSSIVKLIVAYQTISDYLDNLCDRMGVEDYEAFSCLHQSMLDALDPDAPMHDYYSLYTIKDDGGYLNKLVISCRNEILKIPSYKIAKDTALRFAKLYSDMQCYKHINPDIREKMLFDWAVSSNIYYPFMKPWEFCACCGSTLGIFILFSACCDDSININNINELKELYFPWICTLHILLDYFIDYNEDLSNHELNFVGYYRNDDEILSRIKYYIESSYNKAADAEYPVFHRTIISGLLALYLSDKKSSHYNLKGITDEIVSSYGTKLKLMHILCVRLRKSSRI